MEPKDTSGAKKPKLKNFELRLFTSVWQCIPIADFMLVAPVSSLHCPETMVQGNYLFTRTYDAEASFELIFMKFVYLMRVLVVF